jgi:3',5'-cyclic AMP phosphodiesterase CpdA
MPLRFVHCSDIHLLDLAGAHPGRFLNKRLTGGVNLLLARGRKHNHNLFDQIVAHALEYAADRLVITGDLTNLALEPEFELVRRKLREAGLPVTVVPGNHDTYTRGSARERRFEVFLGEFMAGERSEGDYPFIHRQDGVALIGVSTAIPSLPLVAVGRVGEPQLARLGAALERTAAEGLARVIMIHHPVLPGVAKPRHDLLDLGAFGAVIARYGAELILHGHEHRRIEGTLPGPQRPVPVHGVGSGTYLSQKPDRHGAFSLYTVGPAAITRVYHWWNGSRFVADDAAAY